MRILAIRGGNLASLAAPFAIDLSVDPIGTTGIFAITGETGAGKSTILDALCLALYGRYPRVAGARREDTPDPSGEALGSNDGRAILRRGAASGFAEVDFIGQDGVPYRVRWEAFRARGRADGRLQYDRRMLHRLDDGTAVESGKSAVAAAVEQRTDLTFEQFRRTVLLAQGEFDAFLLAAEGERAELLEKITGTAIYSEISKRVHIGTEAVRGAVRTLEVRHDAIGLLDLARREAALAERGLIAADLSRLAGEQQDLQRALDRADRIAVARARFADSQGRLRIVEGEVAANRRDAVRLAELEAVEPLRALADAVAAAEVSERHASAALASADSDLSRAEAAAADTSEALRNVREREAEAEAKLTAFGPIWAEATDLDRDVARTTQAAAEAASAEEALADALRSTEGGLTLLDRSIADNAAMLATVSEQLDAEKGAAFLAERNDEIAPLFAKRAVLRRDLSEIDAALSQASAERRQAEALAAEGSRRVLEIEAKRHRDRARRISREAALAELRADEVRARDAALVDLLDDARAAATLAERYAVSAETLAKAEHDLARSRAGAAVARVRQSEAKGVQTTADAARREIAALADLADGSVSEGAVHLRSLLVPGEACPVCGASEHPHVGSDDRLTRLAAAMTARRAELDEALRRSEDAMRAAAVDYATEEARMAQAEGLAAAMRRQMAEAAEAYAARRPAIEAARSAAGLEAVLPPVLDDGAPARIAQFCVAVEALRTGLSATLDRADQLRAEVANAAETIEAAAGVIEAVRAALDEHRAQAHAAALRGENLAGRAAELAERIASLEREIAPYLGAAGLSLSALDRDTAAAIGTAQTVAATHRARCDRRRDLEGTLGGLSQRRAVEAERHAAAERALAEARIVRELRAAALEALQRRRAGLLGGEATEGHRGRVTAEHRIASEARARAEGAVVEAATELAAIRALHRAALATAARAISDRAAAEAVLTVACAPEPAEIVRGLLGLPPEIRRGLRAAVEARGRAVEAAEAEFATRRADLEALLGEPTQQDLLASLPPRAPQGSQLKV